MSLSRSFSACLARIPFILVSFLLLAACAGSKQLPIAEDLEARYEAAVHDAQTAEPAEIYSGLTPIMPYNEKLIWQGAPGKSLLLVATWTDTPPEGAAAGDTPTTREDLWVTVAPVMRDFCAALSLEGDRLRLRLAQRLGLPPDTGYDRFVEFWVHPSDLFRPCPDPEITDHTCELSTPAPERFIRVSEEHQEWMRRHREAMYDTDSAEGPHPWTRLGYTYDWGDPESEVGPSEFAVRSGATVVINSEASTEAYCGQE